MYFELQVQAKSVEESYLEIYITGVASLTTLRCCSAPPPLQLLIIMKPFSLGQLDKILQAEVYKLYALSSSYAHPNLSQQESRDYITVH